MQACVRAPYDTVNLLVWIQNNLPLVFSNKVCVYSSRVCDKMAWSQCDSWTWGRMCIKRQPHCEQVECNEIDVYTIRSNRKYNTQGRRHREINGIHSSYKLKMQLQESNNMFYNVHTDKCEHFGWSLTNDGRSRVHTKKDVATSKWSPMKVSGSICTHTRITKHNFYQTTHFSHTKGTLDFLFYF